MKYIRYTVSVITAALLLEGCARENLTDGVGDSNVIKIVVQSQNSTDTDAPQGGSKAGVLLPEERSGTESRIMGGILQLTAEDGTTISMACIESDGIGQSDETGTGRAETKGALVNTSSSTGNLQTFTDKDGNQIVTSMTVNAFKSDGTSFLTDEPFTWQSSAWKPQTVRYWPQNTDIGIYAYANLPEEGASVAVDNENKTQTLTYDVPKDVNDQRDILISDYYYGKGNGRGEARLTFHHPLTAIQFKRASDISEHVSGIESITITGVIESGTAVQKTVDGTVRYNEFVWTPGTGDISVTQSANGGALTVSSDDIDGDPFLLIPQKITPSGNPISITVILIVDDHLIPFNASIDEAEFESGKTYTFTIGYTESMQGDVEEPEGEDDPEPGEDVDKGEFYVVNTGTTKCWTRVAIAGNFVNGDGEVMRSWNTEDGLFVVDNGTFSSTTDIWNDGWIKGADGFYYNTIPLEKPTGDSGQTNHKSTALYNSYTLSSENLKSTERLEMMISAQTVEWDASLTHVRNSWGDYAYSLLGGE